MLVATITTSHGVVTGVPCRVYLPRTIMGEPYLEFDLSKAQADALVVPEFSVVGTRRRKFCNQE